LDQSKERVCIFALGCEDRLPSTVDSDARRRGDRIPGVDARVDAALVFAAAAAPAAAALAAAAPRLE
jgi:hypothetical protein